jgi:phosphoglycerate kinase
MQQKIYSQAKFYYCRKFTFYPEEEAEMLLCKRIGIIRRYLCKRCFGTAHRAHASTTIIAQFFPENKCFGLLAKEIESLNRVLNN